MFCDPSENFEISTFLIGLAVGWAVTPIASNLFGAHLVGGISSTVGGIQTIGLGISLLAYGPVGWVLGGIAIASGALSIAFGTAELQEYFSGNNWMKDKMGNGFYNGLMIGNSILSAAVSIGGVKYMQSIHGQRAYALQHFSKYKYGNSAGAHLDRPYYDSILAQKQIIKYGKAVRGNNGAITFYADGDWFMDLQHIISQSPRVVSGTWELTVINKLRIFGHFLLRP